MCVCKSRASVQEEQEDEEFGNQDRGKVCMLKYVSCMVGRQRERSGQISGGSGGG